MASSNSHRWSERCHLKVDLTTDTDSVGLLSPQKLPHVSRMTNRISCLFPEMSFICYVKTEKSTNQTEQTNRVQVLEQQSRKGEERTIKMFKLQMHTATNTCAVGILSA